eukprot:6465591-Amphidinium_carterae.2
MAATAVLSTVPNLQLAPMLAAPSYFCSAPWLSSRPLVQCSSGQSGRTFASLTSWTQSSQFTQGSGRHLGAPIHRRNTVASPSRPVPVDPFDHRTPLLQEAADADSVQSLSIVTWNVVTLAGEKVDDLVHGDKGVGLNSSGKMKFLAQKFAVKQYDVVALQETRIPVTAQSKVADYDVVSLASRSGDGGLHLWLHRRLRPKVLWHKGFGQRVMAVAVQFHTADWIFIVVHAPHDVSAANAHTIFRQNLHEALVSVRPRQRLVVLGDFNLRVKDVDSRVAGPYALSDPVPGSGARTAALAQLLAAHKLLLVNTWISTLDQCAHTWRHPKGALAQIDYIAVQQKDYHLCMTCGVTPSACFAMDHPSDHDLVILRMRLCGSSSSSPQGDGKPLKFVNDQHWVVKAMHDTKPKRTARPKKDWLSNSTWRGMQYMADLRKYYSLRHTSLNRFLLRVCFLAWRTKPIHYQIGGWFQHFVVYRAVVKLSQLLALHKCKKQVRKWQKIDRNEWLAQQCELLNGRWTTDKKGFYSLLRNFRPRDPKTSPPHVLADGTIAATPELHAEAQKDYWCQKLNGVPVSTVKSLMSEQVAVPPPSDEALAEARLLVAEDKVLSLVKHLNPRKSAPDSLSPAVYKELAPWVTSPLREHLVEVMATGVSPDSWKGSQLVAIPKKTTGEKLALRPISLLLTPAKLFGRIILDRISSLMILPQHQLGVGQNTGIDFAHVALNEMLCFAKHHSVGSGVLFVDMVGAFDSIQRELVFGPGPNVSTGAASSSEPPDPESVLPSGVTVQRALDAHEMFRRHVLPLVDQPGVPAQVKRILTETNTNVWTQLPSVPGWSTLQQIATRTGVKQGGVYSPLAYVLYQSAAEAEYERCLREAGLDLVLPRVSLWGTDPDRARISGAHSTLDEVTEGAPDNVPFNLLAFFDDIAIMRWTDDPELIVDIVAKLTDIGINVFRQYNLVFNLSLGKTEATFRFKSRTSELQAGFVATARSCGRAGMALRVNSTDVVQVVRHYKHLGCLVNPSLDHYPEIAARKEEGVKNIGPLLKHADVLPHIKVRLVATFSHSRLLVGLPTKGLLLPHQYRSLAHTYYWCLHRCFETVSDKPSFTHNQLVAKTKLPPFDVLLHVRRLMFFQRLVKTAIVLPTAAIALASCSPRSWCSVLLQSLTRAHTSIAALANVPAPSIETLPVWAAVVSLLQGEWRTYLRTWQDQAVLDATAFAQAAADAGLALRELEAKLQCAHCHRSFMKPVALAAHMKAVHPEHTSSVATKVSGTRCVHCDAQFTHRKRLLAHLRGYALCWEHYAGLPDLSEEQLREQSRLYPESQQIDRLNPPRRGPKRVVHGRPVTETLEPWVYVPLDLTTHD